jgi:hypothetical protein
MQNPFIPQKRANLAIISGEASHEILNNLLDRGIDIVQTIKLDSLACQIACHPDMVMHPIALNTLIIAPEVFDYYSEKLIPYGLKIIKGVSRLEKSYPNDIKYNVCRLGDHFIHKKRYTDKAIKDYYKNFGIDMIDVTQGYTKCSITLVDNQSAITADKIIAEKLILAGYDILLVEKGWVDLPGYEYGFIGGASGNISPKEMVVTGSLINHPDRAHVEAFVKSKGIEIIELSKAPLIDLGTVFLFSV